MNMQDILKSMIGGVNVKNLFKFIAPGLKEKVIKEFEKEVFGDPPVDLVQLDRAKFEQIVRSRLNILEQTIVSYLEKQEGK